MNGLLVFIEMKQKKSKWPTHAFFACFWAYVGQPHNHISWATPMPFASINSTNPRTNPWKFHEKKIENCRSWKMSFFLSQPFWFFFQNFFSKKDFFLLHLNENKQPVHMRYHFFLHYGWFLQNLGKNLIRTNMHTTVWGPNTLTNDTRSQNSNAAYKYLVFCRISSENYKILACFYLQKTKIWMLP